MNDAEIAQLTKHIHETWTNVDCARCGHNDWSVAGVVQLGLSLLDTAGNYRLTGERGFVPNATLVCKRCGSTELVNLKIAGLVG